MPSWSRPARSYATGVLANETRALVRTTNTPELFGGELRILAAGALMRTVEVALSVLD